MNFSEELARQFLSARKAHPTATAALIATMGEQVSAAMDRQPGAFTYSVLFDEVRPTMPDGADIGISPALAEAFLWEVIIPQVVKLRSQSRLDPETELAMLEKIKATMKKHGFKTAGPAIEFLRKQQAH